MIKATSSMFLLLAVSTLLLTGTSVAGPTQLILGVSTTGDFLFTNSGGNVSFTLTGDCGQGPSDCVAGYAYYGALVGNYSMWLSGASSPPSLGAPINNLYPVNMNGATLNFASTVQSYHLNGTINLIEVNGGTQTPTFDGYIAISDTNLPGYANGDKSPIDFTINLAGNPSLEDVYSGKFSNTSGYLSSGQLPPAVPEPGSLLLFGSGLVGVGALVRRKFGL